MARRRKKSKGWMVQILFICMLLLGVMFSAMAVIMIVGMIPTIVSAIVDSTKGKMRTVTVGAVNFAGCTPFLVEIFKKGNSMETAISYILEPRTIVVMYMAAGMGYLIDWAMTGIVSSVMVQRAKRRLKDVQKQQKDLVDRWGMEVTGTLPLDEYGFPKEAFIAKTPDE
jgi:hypothetical protein